jgi:hypothetical protein
MENSILKENLLERLSPAFSILLLATSIHLWEYYFLSKPGERGNH